MLNRIVVIGRLTKDVELRYTPTGKGVSNFSIACERDFKNQSGEKEVDFINVVTWGKLAETVANYLSRGKLAAVEGRLQIRSYEDKEGQRRQATEVVADSVQFLSPKDGSQPAGETPELPPDDQLPF